MIPMEYFRILFHFCIICSKNIVTTLNKLVKMLFSAASFTIICQVDTSLPLPSSNYTKIVGNFCIQTMNSCILHFHISNRTALHFDAFQQRSYDNDSLAFCPSNFPPDYIPDFVHGCMTIKPS